MVGWHHQLNGHEFEQTPGVGDGQGGLVCCDPRGRRESDTTERLNLVLDSKWKAVQMPQCSHTRTPWGRLAVTTRTGRPLSSLAHSASSEGCSGPLSLPGSLSHLLYLCTGSPVPSPGYASLLCRNVQFSITLSPQLPGGHVTHSELTPS